MKPLQSFRNQLGKLQRLAQPYFLPIEETNAWQFLLLIFALLAVVVGTTFLLLTALVALSEALAPELQSRFLPGVSENIANIWSGPFGPLVISFLLAGSACFVFYRSKLRNGRWLPWLMLGMILQMTVFCK